MTTGTLVWIVIFLAAALLFFVLASVIIVVGFKDLRSLLSRSERSNDRTDTPGRHT